MAGIEAQFHELADKLTVTQAKMVAEKTRSIEVAQELEIARAIAGEKEKEVQQAIWARLEAQEEAARLRVELEVAPVEVQALTEGAAA